MPCTLHHALRQNYRPRPAARTPAWLRRLWLWL